MSEIESKLIDKEILASLRNNILNAFFGYSDLYEIARLISIKFENSGLTDFYIKERIYLLIGFGLIELESEMNLEKLKSFSKLNNINLKELIYNNEGKTEINYKNYNKFILRGKITSAGLEKYDILDKYFFDN